MPELSESRDPESIEIERRYRAAEARAREARVDSEKQAQVISLSWARNQRRWKKAR